ncbi:hypothetical protein [Nonomuraea sp. NEAU-A123]|nr:hypothetical protein [Nonomuraea sp. NEAU-A123]
MTTLERITRRAVVEKLGFGDNVTLLDVATGPPVTTRRNPKGEW